MLRLTLLASTTSTLLINVAAAQIHGFQDDFSNGNFTENPTWDGQVDRWSVVPFNDGYGLQTDGIAQQDTLTLFTASDVAFGSWEFTFHHEEIALSNFNGARIYLMADSSRLKGQIRGYYVQMGTNNLRRVELWRQDGDPSERVRLGESESNFIEGTENTLRVSVTRSDLGMWLVAVDEEVLFDAIDDTYGFSSFFGLWVKHSSAAGRSYLFDDFVVDGTPYVDNTPPEPLAAKVNPSGDTVSVSWSEPLRSETVLPGGFFIAPDVGHPASVLYENSTLETHLIIQPPLAPAEYSISFSAISDTVGNVVPPGTSLTFTFDPDLDPPVLLDAIPVGYHQLLIVFDEPIHDGSASEPSNYRIDPGMVSPVSAEHAPGGDSSRVLITLSSPLQDQQAYTASVFNIEDLAGNVLLEASVTFFVGQPPPPAVGDVVVNEVFYDPPEDELEFVELFNRSDKFFDLQEFEISDDRMQPVRVANRPSILPPGGYAVLARDSASVADRFSGVRPLRVFGMAIFRRSGDAVVLHHDGHIIDSVAYRPSWGGQGVSLERIDPEGPSTHTSNWGSSTAAEGATPGAVNSIYRPDREMPVALFADQTSDSSIAVFFNKPLDPASGALQNIWLGGSNPTWVGYNEDGFRLLATFSSDVVHNVVTVRNIRDLSGNQLAFQEIDLARAAQPGELLLNEIMFAPLADRFDNRPDQPQYVEVFNRGPSLVTLRNLFWTGPVDESGSADTLWLTAELVSVPAGGYAVFFSDPTADTDPSDSMLARAFPEIDFSNPHMSLVPLRGSSLGLRRTGHAIRLHRADRTPLDAISFETNWHHPDLLETAGVSIERISLDVETGHPANWTSSVALSGGTPGMPNSVSVPTSDMEMAPGLTIEPRVFSPDGTGHDDVAAIRYRLSSDASVIRVRIFDASGRLVRTVQEVGLAGRMGTVLWDGLGDSDNRLRLGIYVVLFEAVDASGGLVEVFKRPVVLARSLN